MKRLLLVLLLLVAVSGNYLRQCYSTKKDRTSPTGDRDILLNCNKGEPLTDEYYCMAKYFPNTTRRAYSDVGEAFESHVFYDDYFIDRVKTTYGGVSCMVNDHMRLDLDCEEHSVDLPQEGCIRFGGYDKFQQCFCKGDACGDIKSFEAIYAKGAKYFQLGGCDQIQQIKRSQVVDREVTEKKRKCWSTRRDSTSVTRYRDVVLECETGDYCGSTVEKDTEDKVYHVLTDRAEKKSHVLHFLDTIFQCFDEEYISAFLGCDSPDEGCFEISPTTYFCFCKKQACNNIGRLEELAAKKIFRRDGSCISEPAKTAPPST